ncbi:hypothetical protein IV102_03715 [bacterium]|nr:hypothetical protein [bacterium]
MAKRDNIKKIQKKREKRNQQSRQRHSGGRSTGRLGSADPNLIERIVDRGWKREPLPVPAGLIGQLTDFDIYARGLLDGTWQQVQEAYPARFDREEQSARLLSKVLDESTSKEIFGWLLANCRDASEQRLLLAQLEEGAAVRSPADLPGVRPLLRRWQSSLPANLERWIPALIGHPTGPQVWELNEDWLQLAGRVGEELDLAQLSVALTPSPPPYNFGPFLSGLRDLGCLMGWNVLSKEDYARIGREAVWKWTEDSLALPDLQTFLAETSSPAQKRVRLGSVLLDRLDYLLELLPEWRADEFLYDPQSPDWVLDLAANQLGAGRPEDCLSILLQLKERSPEVMDVYEALVEVGIELKFPHGQLLEFIEAGLNAADQQSGPYLDAETELEYRQRMERWRLQFQAP